MAKTPQCSAMFLLALCAVVQPLKADCENGPTFPEMILAQDKTTFAWQLPTDVDFAKGDLAQLPDYTIWLRGTLTAESQLDTTNDTVGPGYGVFYLVKTTGPPCGSWQTAFNAEVQRDADILGSCSDSPLTEQEMQAAVDAAFVVAPQAWGEPSDAQLFFQVVQNQLGCALDIPSPAESDSVATVAGFPGYDANHFYCGVYATGETGGPIVGILPTSQCMNMSCYNHDFDYYSNCVGGICAFSIQTTPWDNTLALSCGNAPDGCLQLTNPYYWWDLLTCGYIGNAIASPLNDPFCIAPPCNAPSEDCCSATAKCFIPDGTISPTGLWLFDSDVLDGAGAHHGTLVGDSTFGPGVHGKAVYLDGDGDYIDFEDTLEIEPPLSVSAWVKRHSSDVVRVFTSDDNASEYSGVWLQYYSPSTLSIGYGDGGPQGGVSRRTKAASALLLMNTWYHVAGVVRGPTDMSLYVDGVDIGGTYSGSGDPIAYTTSPATAGRSQHGAVSFSDAAIDDLAVYDHDLTGDEVTALYRLGHETTCPAE